MSRFLPFPATCYVRKGDLWLSLVLPTLYNTTRQTNQTKKKQVAGLVAKAQPQWSDDSALHPPYDQQTGIHMKRLSNGIRFNYKVQR